MPKAMPDSLLAPCGLNCLLCHHHCKNDEPCEGCREGNGKSEHCRSCDILRCAAEKQHLFCIECEQFPCEKLTSFNQMYIRRFGHAFLPNAYYMKEHGKEQLAAKMAKEWTCPDCGGIVCIHDDTCSQCGQKHS